MRTAAIMIVIALAAAAGNSLQPAPRDANMERPASERLVQSIFDAADAPQDLRVHAQVLVRGCRIVFAEYFRHSSSSDLVVNRECRNRRLRDSGVLNRRAKT